MKKGDIILIRSTGLKAWANRAGQFLITGKLPAFTHVMICISNDVVMDATLEEGVALRNVIHEVIGGNLSPTMCDNGHMVVLRNEHLESKLTELGNEYLRQFSRLTAAQLHKKYNKAFGLPSPSDRDPYSKKAKKAFCSELVALVLEPLGVLPEGWKVSTKIFPVHFQKLKDAKCGWIDVTNEWRNELERHKRKITSSEKTDAYLLAQMMNIANQSIESLKAFRSTKDEIDRLSERTKKLPGTTRAVVELLRLIETDPDLRNRIQSAFKKKKDNK